MVRATFTCARRRLTSCSHAVSRPRTIWGRSTPCSGGSSVTCATRRTRSGSRFSTPHGGCWSCEAGDCDDMTILLGALVKSVGHPVRVVLTGPDSRRPGLFSHIYLEARHHDQWIPLDATMPYAWGGRRALLSAKLCPLRRNLPMTAQPPAPSPPPAPGTAADARARARAEDGCAICFVAYARREFSRADPRVKALWDLLRRRQLLGRDPWIRARLRYIWQKGLPTPDPRPRTTRRLLALLRNWNVARARRTSAARDRPVARAAATMPRPMQRLQPVAASARGDAAAGQPASAGTSCSRGEAAAAERRGTAMPRRSCGGSRAFPLGPSSVSRTRGSCRRWWSSSADLRGSCIDPANGSVARAPTSTSWKTRRASSRMCRTSSLHCRRQLPRDRQGDRRMNLGLDELMIVNPGLRLVRHHVVPRRRRGAVSDRPSWRGARLSDAASVIPRACPHFFLGEDGTLYEQT